MRKININDFARLYKSGEVRTLIDVRTPAEYDSAHLTGAVNLPLSKISVAALPLEYKNSESLFLICQSGGRSSKACQILEGLDNAISVEGGTKAAEAAGLNITRSSRKTISLERQVRITAGALVLISIILAQTLIPAFVYLAAFVGAGLIFAGVTDTCGMAMLLARMPWNKGGQDA